MPRPERLSYEECRKRSAEGSRLYWEAERPARETQREAVRARAADEIGTLPKREVLIAGAIAYWCEGAKSKAHHRQVHIHENADAGAAEEFWREVTAADPTQFQRTTLKTHNPRTVRKNVGADYHGCLIVVVRQSADLYRRIEGWVRATMAGN
jgi:hypothetical protein